MKDPREDYQYSCPKCNVCNANRIAVESEDDWVMTVWGCNDCDFVWREHFEFTHWDQD